MKKWIAAPVFAGVLAFGGANIAEATASQVPAAADADDDDDDGGDAGLWGLLGLAGLVGLAGLKRRDRVETHHTPSYTTPPQDPGLRPKPGNPLP